MPTGKYIRKPLTEEHKKKIGLAHLGMPISAEWRANISRSLMGKVRVSGTRHGAWKGNDAVYSTIHGWLKKHYGKANKCEAKACGGRCKRYEWALKKGKEHIHERGNYLMLCSSCHKFYDRKVRNKSGYMGVQPSENGKRWEAKIKILGKSVYLGRFDTPEEASKAYAEAAKNHRPVIE